MNTRVEMIAQLTASLTHDFINLSKAEKQRVSPGFERNHGWIEVYTEFYEAACDIVDQIKKKHGTYARYFEQRDGVWCYDAASAYLQVLLEADRYEDRKNAIREAVAA